MSEAVLKATDTEQGINFNVDLGLENEEMQFNEMDMSQRVIYSLGEIMSIVQKPELIHRLAVAVHDGNIQMFASVVEEVMSMKEAVPGVESEVEKE